MKRDFFIGNRYELSKALNGGVAVLAGYTQMQRGNDMAFGFEQESNFWWLTGIEFPDWWLIIDGTRSKSWLVSPHISEAHHIFDGSLSSEDAMKISGVDEVIEHDQALDLLRDLGKKHSVVYMMDEYPYGGHQDFTLNPAGKVTRDIASRSFNAIQDCRKELTRLRAIKQPEEIVAIKKAVDLTVNAFTLVKNKMDSYSYEYEVEADFTYHFRSRGARGHAYDPIVASGKNACTLHYVANNDKLKKRQLVLLDIGARTSGYAADVTRTYVYGEPTKRHMQVHAVVQTAHQRIIELVQPHLDVEQYQRDVDAIMIDALLDLGLMSSPDDKANYHKYFPHAISHGLGVDVHDSLGAPTQLQAGMVLTVEPGIYIPEESIGVRIEDDILITEEGRTNLSARLSTDL